MSYGVFEAAATDGHEEEVAASRRNKAINAAIFDVRESYGEFVCAATDKEDFSDRIALVKNDMMKTVAQTVMPVPGVMRKVEGALKASWKKKSQQTIDPGYGASAFDSSEELAFAFYDYVKKVSPGNDPNSLDYSDWDDLARSFCVDYGVSESWLSQATADYAPGGADFFSKKKANVSGGGYSLDPVYGDSGLEYYVFTDSSGSEVERVYPYETDENGEWLELSLAEQQAEFDSLVEEFGDPRYSKKEAVNFRDIEPLDGGIWNIETWDSTMTAQVTSRADGDFDYEVYDGQGNFLDGQTVPTLANAIEMAKEDIAYYENLTAADVDPEADELFTDQEW